MIAALAALVDATVEGERLIADLRQRVHRIRSRAVSYARHPRIYFEEWNDPLISGIRWVSELINVAGGEDCYAEESQRPAARDRIIVDPADVIRRAPDIVIGSWCGKKFQAEQVRSRAGWDTVPAVRENHLYEIKSADILSPGPACITEGLTQLEGIVQRWQAQNR
jgi:iron complex transport system substrate-binding protein